MEDIWAALDSIRPVSDISPNHVALKYRGNPRPRPPDAKASCPPPSTLFTPIPYKYSAQRKDSARTQTHPNFAPRNTPAMSSDSWPQQLKCAHCRLSTSSAQLISISYSQRLGRQVLGADAGFEQRGSTG